MNNTKYREILTETFGKDYCDLMIKEKQEKATSDMNAKLCYVSRLMGQRKLVGLPTKGTDFDNLYDLPLHELMRLEIQMSDYVSLYMNAKGGKNGRG